MCKSKSINEARLKYAAPEIASFEAVSVTVLCLSGGVSLGNLEEINETW